MARKTVLSRKKPKVNQELIDFARETFICNQLKNKYDREYEKMRKGLYEKMKEAGIETIPIEAEVEGDKFSCDWTVKEKDKSGIDVVALKNATNEETFMQCITASVTKVREFCGGIIATKCTVPLPGKEDVHIENKKRIK